MSGSITVAGVQAAPLDIAGLPVFGRHDTVAQFRADVLRVRSAVTGPALIVYPEIHLFGTEDTDMLAAAAEPLDGPLIAALGEVARAADAWLVPGSVCELGENGELFNTAPVFAPDGRLVASYRKIFPWRPFEKYTPGDEFVTVDIPDVGRLGLSICYDAWFPEVSRHLAWMGADVIVNVVKTTTEDRSQELVLARANSIVNQVFTVSVNCAGPVGNGRSLIVDPEGTVLQETPGAAPDVLCQHIDFGAVAAVRERGTAGTNRMWDQFRPSDRPIGLPLYQGRIDPRRWSPSNHHAN
ncbi:carbon-nitrogen hydrolase family protein [Mycolicibacterium peregrinum]|uniref:Carbon-nitrogen hydrolase family protein n=1 Tax=Mycolicibacterium peregrinum TaxID=43304 RepID=A0A4Z0HLH7_MYCPR|nr:carbon-nitrogen hydrolase family protein [Mycolicibacterium peregrinum]TGB35922.1 carbon-nitrogen hydrolase family protein [Mycolicibacterium peregrinum]TGB36677.1 carbon-nitrogen hydrolase family protein [Mycolicibacterium peregrinum]